jgi:hypothetical protein
MPEAGSNRREVFRNAFVMRQRMAALLREQPRTVPALADALQASTQDVMLWLMAMLRYKEVEAVGKPDKEGYFTYTFKEANQ